jgi:ankyrin repeat protein
MSYTATTTTTEQVRVNIQNAILNGNITYLRRFINSTNINEPLDTLGNTPLHIAIMSKNRLVIKYLIEKGGNGHIKNKLDETAEELACRYFIPEYFEYQRNLLENDLIDEKIKNENNKKQLNISTEQVKTMKRKYEDLNDKYNDVYHSYRSLQVKFDDVFNENNSLKKQNEFYKSSNDARKKLK